MRRRKLTEYAPDPRNANKGTERGQYMLDESVQTAGATRSLVASADDVIPIGNHAMQAFVDAGLIEVVEVETDGNVVVVHKRRDWASADDPQVRKAAHLDNRTSQVNLQWDAEQLLADMQSGVDLSAMFMPDELDGLLERAAADEAALLSSLEDGTPLDVMSGDVPDALWATDNDWGVPLLDTHWQADALDLPVVGWGSIARKTRMKGTWHFYTEDNRFEALWADPSPIVNTRCVNVIEPNFSVFDQMPRAVALWGTFRKRWLARWWQSFGIRVFVDLNVSEEHADLNWLGVPQGWRAYATRGYTDRLDATEREYAAACEHAGTDDVLFVVVGGGKAVKARCQERGWTWVIETMDKRKAAREADDGEG